LIPRAWRPVRATDVAATMLHAARASHPPQCIASAAMHGAAVTLDRESASRLDTGIR
jgi:hypothetical protein